MPVPPDYLIYGPTEEELPMNPLPPGGLTSEEVFILQWLSKEDSSAYGECEGLSLNVLLNCGLASVENTPNGFSRVSVTDKGRTYLKDVAGETP